MQVSVVITVLNEASSLPGLLGSLADQTRPPDQIVVCDGGSTDGTLAQLKAEERLPLRIVQRLGANIPQGRNVAIDAAVGDVIAVTDAGVELCPRWLEQITAPFADPSVHTVAGFFRPAPQSVFETAMGATVLPEQREIRPDRFLPSSRAVAVRKSAFEKVGGYPEWLDYCEDLILDLRLRDRYGPFHFAPEALVYFRPRPNLRAFFVQYYRYARGDGKANLWPRRHAIRYVTYLVGVPLIAVAGALISHWLWLAYLAGLAAMCGKAWRRLGRMWGDLTFAQRIQAALWVPVIRISGDIAKMIGYPAGVWWRWRGRPDRF